MSILLLFCITLHLTFLFVYVLIVVRRKLFFKCKLKVFQLISMSTSKVIWKWSPHTLKKEANTVDAERKASHGNLQALNAIFSGVDLD